MGPPTPDGDPIGDSARPQAEQIVVAADVSRRSVFRYLDAFLTGGVEALLKREHKGGRRPTLAGADREAFLAQLRDGEFPRVKDVQAWIEAPTRRRLSLPGVYVLLGKAGGVLKWPRKTLAKKDAAQAEPFRKRLAGRVRLMHCC